jgi:hypothetical protein
MRLIALALFLLGLGSAHAELPPSAYEAMQKRASDFIQIEVLRVDIEPGDQPNQQRIVATALVSEVTRSQSDLKPGDFVTITYVVTEHPEGWVGPGEIPILAEKEQTIAYLTKNDATGEFTPAAGRMSFANF